MTDLLLENFNVHDHLKGKSVDELKRINAEDRLPYAVAVINLTGSLNVGIIIRTACNLGAERVFVFGRRKYDARSCVGSHNYIPVEKIDGFVDNRAANPVLDPKKFMDVMRDWDYIPLYIETDGDESIDQHMKRYGRSWQACKENPCLVFGSEGEGIPAELLEEGLVLTIPQLGVIRSYNVSAAASIAMWETYKALSAIWPAPLPSGIK